jgi:hypothetical protein
MIVTILFLKKQCGAVFYLNSDLFAVRLHKAKLSADGTAVDIVSEERPIALVLKHVPVSTSFGIILQECVSLSISLYLFNPLICGQTNYSNDNVIGILL